MDYRAHVTHIIALFALLTLSGCASWFESSDKDPQVHLIKVELVRAKLLEQRFKLHFTIDNPNDSTLTVRGLDYTVYLGSIKLVEGEYSEWFSVKPNSRATFVVPIRTNLWPHVRPLVKMLESPDRPIPYRLEGTLETGLLFGYDVHLTRKGEIIPGDFIPE